MWNSTSKPLPDFVWIRDDIAEDIQKGRPVVALESAVVTHGLPPPHHMNAVQAMETSIRNENVLPAVCVVDRGVLRVGATPQDLERIAADTTTEKASARDLGFAVTSGISAGLTVSASLCVAHAAGIRVFATGGIGGVHVGAAETGDISSDLAQIARTPVITVCAGAKSVLDIPRTLEQLETLGVAVVGYRTSIFPAFYLQSSGQPVRRLDSAEQIALAARGQWALTPETGMVVGNPISGDAAISDVDWQLWIARAHDDALHAGIRGGAVTPFLLARVGELSGGRTVAANLALLGANAALAARIAVAFAT